MNERERLEAILDGDPVDRPACISPMQTATKDLMARSDVLYHELLDNPVKMSRLAFAAHEVTGLESVRLPFDYSVEASAFGISSGRVSTQRHPLILHRIINEPGDIETLEIPNPAQGKCGSVLEAVGLLEARSTTVPIIIGIISPLMLAMQLRGEAETLLDMYKEPGLLRRLLEKTTAFDMDYMRQAFNAGADHLCIDDSLSSGDFLTKEQFMCFSEPYADRIAFKCRSYDFESIVHICGNSDCLIDRLVAIDTDGLSIDQDTDVSALANAARGRRAAIIGNLCPTRTLLMGNQRAVIAATRRCIEAGVDAVAPGCNLETYTPTENIIAMVAATKKYGPPRRKGGW